MDRDDGGLLAGLRPADTPPGLAERVLAAARGSRAPRSRRLEDVLWGSRGVRLGWLAATAALLALNLLVPVPGRAPSRPWRAEGASAGGPTTDEPRQGRQGVPRWSDQRRLVCRLLGDCDVGEEEPVHQQPLRGTHDSPTPGGKA